MAPAPRRTPRHRAVAQHVHIVDTVRPGGHPGDQAADLQSGVRSARAGECFLPARDLEEFLLQDPGAVREGLLAALAEADPDRAKAAEAEWPRGSCRIPG